MEEFKEYLVKAPNQNGLSEFSTILSAEGEKELIENTADWLIGRYDWNNLPELKPVMVTFCEQIREILEDGTEGDIIEEGEEFQLEITPKASLV